MSPVLAGRFFTTEPPGKHPLIFFYNRLWSITWNGQIWKRYTGRGMGEGRLSPTSSLSGWAPCCHLTVHSMDALQTLWFRFNRGFMSQVWLITSVAIGDGFNISSRPHPHPTG